MSGLGAKASSNFLTSGTTYRGLHQLVLYSFCIFPTNDFLGQLYFSVPGFLIIFPDVV